MLKFETANMKDTLKKPISIFENSHFETCDQTFSKRVLYTFYLLKNSLSFTGICPFAGVIIYDSYLHLGTFCDDGSFTMPLHQELLSTMGHVIVVYYSMSTLAQVSLTYTVHKKHGAIGLPNVCYLQDQFKTQKKNVNGFSDLSVWYFGHPMFEDWFHKSVETSKVDIDVCDKVKRLFVYYMYSFMVTDSCSLIMTYCLSYYMKREYQIKLEVNPAKSCQSLTFVHNRTSIELTKYGQLNRDELSKETLYCSNEAWVSSLSHKSQTTFNMHSDSQMLFVYADVVAFAYCPENIYLNDRLPVFEQPVAIETVPKAANCQAKPMSNTSRVYHVFKLCLDEHIKLFTHSIVKIFLRNV